MKLEPVFVVAPRPEAPAITTRRAFLAMAGSFALGAATGFAVDRYRAPPPGPKPRPPDLRLEWLHNLCIDSTSLADLIADRAAVVQYIPQYPGDAVLWHGVYRLATGIIADVDLPGRERLAIEVLDLLDHGPQPVGFAASEVDGPLRRIARWR
jgi:hypothetical protein